jgi:hypothetical protein
VALQLAPLHAAAMKRRWLDVAVRALADQLLIRGEDSAQRIEHVLASFFSRPTLTDRARHLEHTSDDPSPLVGRVEGDREESGTP